MNNLELALKIKADVEDAKAKIKAFSDDFRRVDDALQGLSRSAPGYNTTKI